MKIFTLLVLFTTLLFSKEYYAKTEPLELYTIASNVSGEVLKADEKLLGKKLGSKAFIVIDDSLDKINLEQLQKKIDAIYEMIEADKAIIVNLEESLEKKKQNYNRIKNLKSKSKTQKDALFFDLVATKNQLLATKKELASFQSQLADLTAQKTKLLKTIHDKHISANGLYLYELLVKKHQVVSPATPLAKVVDLSKAILTIYVDANELKGIKQKSVYINGAKTDYRVSRVSYVADATHLSRYKVQIIIDAPKIFSKLVKVELK